MSPISPALNGGVWRTVNFHSNPTLQNGPHWTPATLHTMPCNSIGSVSAPATNPNIVAAGCGFPSNSANRGGEPLGVMISVDYGATWQMTNFPKGYWISSILVDAPPHATVSQVNLLVAVSAAIFLYLELTGYNVDSYGIGSDPTNPMIGGIWKSTNG